MITVALCDDEPDQLRQAEQLLEEYQKAHPELQMKQTVFSSAVALIEDVSEGRYFDLYLLDIIMPGQDGISLGVELRKQDGQAAIIYLTTSPDYAVESYMARAFHYLLKPVEKDRLFSVLDEAMEQIVQRQNTAITLKTKDGWRQLAVHSILYGELSGRRVRYHLADGSALEGMSLRESFRSTVAPLLEHKEFVLCAASFVVNLSFVERVDREGLQLKGGERLPLSRALREQVTDRWMDYYLEGGTSRCW